MQHVSIDPAAASESLARFTVIARPSGGKAFTLPAEWAPENLPAQAQQPVQGTSTPASPEIASSEPEIGQYGAEIVAATVDLAFSAWLTAQFGPWIIAGRQSAKMTQARTRAITPRQYAKLKAQWEMGEREPLPPAPPSVEKPGDDLAAMVAALTARIEALEGAARGENGCATPSATTGENAVDLSTGIPMRDYIQMPAIGSRKQSRYVLYEGNKRVGEVSSEAAAKRWLREPVEQVARDAQKPGLVKPKRTPAQVRLLMRYLAVRKERAELIAANAEWEDLQHRTWEESMGHKMNRRRAIKRALRLRDSRSFWMKKAGQWKDQWSMDVEFRDGQLIDAHTQAEILGKSLRETSERALKAETALAAIQARADGWPPAVRPASVVVNIQRAA